MDALLTQMCKEGQILTFRTCRETRKKSMNPQEQLPKETVLKVRCFGCTAAYVGQIFLFIKLFFCAGVAILASLFA
jgi:hypothetical protein